MDITSPIGFKGQAMVNLARQLERELAQATEGLFNVGLHYDELLAHNQENAATLAQAQARIAELEYDLRFYGGKP